jgi:hypothetical protein
VLFVYETIDLADDMGEISAEGRPMKHFIVSGILRRTIVLSNRQMQPLARLSSSVNTKYSTFTTNPRTSLYISAGQPSPSALTWAAP